MLFQCPGCSCKLQVQEQFAAQRVKCPKCGTIVAAPAALPSLSANPAASRVFSAAPEQPAPPAAPRAEQVTNAGVDTNGGAPLGLAKELYDFLAPPEGPAELGRLGGYRVVRVLGAGGMGVVFEAEDLQLKRSVALKAMKPAIAASASAKARFVREAQAMAALKHDHVITIYQVSEDRGIPFLAMEFLEGEALDDRIKRAGKLPTAEVIRIGREMAEGLHAAHKRGLIHRDVKPGNVWLEGERSRVKILDFGLARAADDDTHLTQSGAIVGTPAYMAPEQASSKAVDHRADLFSLGCVLYRLSAGELPFKGSNTMSTLMALALEEPLPPRQLNPTTPPRLSALIMQLLAKDREQRPASAAAVIAVLDALKSEPIDVDVVLEVQAIDAPAWPERPAADGHVPQSTADPSWLPTLALEGTNAGLSPVRAAAAQPWISGLGIGSLSLGGGALLLAWMPCISLFTLPFSTVGLILGVVSLVLTLTGDRDPLRRERQALILPVAGTALNLLDLLLALVLTFGPGHH